jgi:glycosyltransferase involved in cell wall biosynthesis
MKDVKVSVVVPVFDPGSSIDRCIDSMLGQSLPHDQFEVLFVDDGSTDDAPARLDRLAAETPNVRVIHTPNSGWPGRPRNIGIQHATGEYVQFLDQDDHMAPEALERLYDMGRRNDSDIVIGKVASDFRGVPSAIFRRDRDVCTIHDAPLIDSLTPHKMFRRAMLADRGIAFPEGRRRLEDQLFVVRALFAARVVSVLASYPCYFYLGRADGRNAGSTPIEPFGYFSDLREVIDIVLANTEPGEARARLLRRFCRVEMLGRLSEPKYPVRTLDFRRALYDAIRPLYLDVADELVESGFEAVPRMRGRLLRDDRPDAILELATRLLALKAVCRVEDAHWKAGRFHVEFVVGIEHGDGSAFSVSRLPGGGAVLDPRLTDGLLSEAVALSGADLAAIGVSASVRDRSTAVEWRVPVHVAGISGVDGADDATSSGVAIRGTAIFDPTRLGGGAPLGPGDWEPMLRLRALGLNLRTPLGGQWSQASNQAVEPRLVGRSRWFVEPKVGLEGGLCLEVRAVGPSDARRVRAMRGRFHSLSDGVDERLRAVFGRLPRRLRASLLAVVRSTGRFRAN